MEKKVTKKSMNPLSMVVLSILLVMPISLSAQTLSVEQKTELGKAAEVGTIEEVVAGMVSKNYRLAAEIAATAVEFSPEQAADIVKIAVEKLLEQFEGASDEGIAVAQESQSSKSMGGEPIPMAAEAYSLPDSKLPKRAEQEKQEEEFHHVNEGPDDFLSVEFDEANPI